MVALNDNVESIRIRRTGALLRVLYYADHHLRGFVTTFKPHIFDTPEHQAECNAVTLCKIQRRRFFRIHSASLLGNKLSRMA